MNRRLEGWPDVARAGAGIVVITIRHIESPEQQRELAVAAEAERQKERWPRGLLSWALFTGTDGRALLSYEQWSDDAALDTALSGPVPYVPGIPGTEPAAPLRYRVARTYPGGAPGETPGCLVTPVFDTDGPERQRHFLDTLFTMAGDDTTRDVGQMPGALSAYFHVSADGTRVLGYAEWTDEEAHLAAVAAEGTAASRQRLTGEIPGVRPSGYHRWHLHTALDSKITTEGSPPVILVTGATGNVGRNVGELLLDRGVKVRAVTRDPAAARIPDGAEVVTGDLMTDPEGLVDARHGVDAVFLNAAAFLHGPDGGAQAATFLQLARKQGVSKVVLLTSGTTQGGVPAEQQSNVIGRMHRVVEEAVETSGLGWTLLRPGEFMANSLNWAPQIRATDVVCAPYGDAQWAPIHERDIADVAVQVLTTDGHFGRTYQLTGPEQVTYHERARLIGAAVGRTVRLEEITPDRARSAMIVGGVPAAVADTLLALTATGVERAEEISPAVRELTGKPGRTFAQWARENKAAFESRPATS